MSGLGPSFVLAASCLSPSSLYSFFGSFVARSWLLLGLAATSFAPDLGELADGPPQGSPRTWAFPRTGHNCRPAAETPQPLARTKPLTRETWGERRSRPFKRGSWLGKRWRRPLQSSVTVPRCLSRGQGTRGLRGNDTKDTLGVPLRTEKLPVWTRAA